VREYVFAGVVKVDPDNTDTGDTGAVPEPEPAAYEIVSVGIVGVASADAAEKLPVPTLFFAATLK
jgi:hypothetical protein